MLPIGDSPRDPNHIPWVTLALLVANVAVGLLTLPLMYQAWMPGDAGYDWMVSNVPPGLAPPFSGHALVVWSFGFRPSQPSVFTSATSTFLHAGALHLVTNLLYLWIYGPNVERRLGRIGFLLLYMTAGILGNVMFALSSLGSETTVVGASGAIFGLLGAYIVFFPTNRIRMLVPPITLPAWLVLMFYELGFNLWLFFTDHSSVVAHASHLGGFFGGAMLAWGFLIADPNRSPTGRLSQAESELRRAMGLLDEGMLVEAHQMLTALALPGQPDRVARVALRHLERLESDPTYQRVARRR